MTITKQTLFKASGIKGQANPAATKVIAENRKKMAFPAEILRQVHMSLQNTVNKRGYFMYPLSLEEFNEQGKNPFVLLNAAVTTRLGDLDNEAIYESDEAFKDFATDLKGLFAIVIDLIEKGFGFPPEDAEVQEALLGLLKAAIDELDD